LIHKEKINFVIIPIVVDKDEEIRMRTSQG
jgi:hypothetical protein